MPSYRRRPLTDLTAVAAVAAMRNGDIQAEDYARALLDRAQQFESLNEVKLTGGLDRSTVLREGLKAPVERESAARLARLGGTQPQLESVPRRRAAAAT